MRKYVKGYRLWMNLETGTLWVCPWGRAGQKVYDQAWNAQRWHFCIGKL